MFPYESFVTLHHSMKVKKEIIQKHLSCIHRYHPSADASTEFRRNLVINTKRIFAQYYEDDRLYDLPFMLDELIKGLALFIDESMWNKY